MKPVTEEATAAAVDRDAAAAAEAQEAAGGQYGRQEYPHAVGDTQMIVTPGVAAEGHVDIDVLRDGAPSIARDADRSREQVSDRAAVRVRFATDSLDGMFGRAVVGAEPALHAVLDAFDRRAYCADAHVWINPEDNGWERSEFGRNGCLVVRCRARRVLVVGHDPIAHLLRALLADGGVAGWKLCLLPDRQVLLEVAEPILGHRAYNMLTRAGFRTVDEVVATPDGALLNIRNLGTKSLTAIRDMATVHQAGLLAPATPDEPGVPEFSDIHGMATDQLVTLWADALRELQRRGVLTTFPGPDTDSPEGSRGSPQ